jgi:uncharacterized protein (DUF58 family)
VSAVGRARRYPDPDLARRLGRLEIGARRLVEGFLAGLHRSPYRGFSVEFAEHRTYSPGDDPRHIDWRVYAKRERYFVKQYHEETNLIATVLLDGSASMTFASGGPTKLEYAAQLGGAICYLVLRQNDAAALGLFDRGPAAYLPPGTRFGFLERIAGLLERFEATGETDTGAALAAFGRLIGRRGIVVVISDFLDRPESILAGLKVLKARGHEVIAIQVLDPAERDFPLRGHVRFEGIEADLRVRAEAQRIRDAYLRALEEHLKALRQGASRAGIDYRFAATSDPPEELLLTYLASRARVRRVAR